MTSRSWPSSWLWAPASDPLVSGRDLTTYVAERLLVLSVVLAGAQIRGAVARSMLARADRASDAVGGIDVAAASGMIAS
jgi:hypothetical protein